MRLVTLPGLIGLLALSATAFAQPMPSATIVAEKNDPGKVVRTSVTKAFAEVAALDTANRKITLKGTEGQTFDIVAGDEVKNFNQINVGDKVSVEYVRGVTAELKKTAKGQPKPAASLVTETEKASAKPGEKPAGAEGVKVTALVDVIAVSPKNKTITVRGPRGNVEKLDVKNPEHFKVVKKGDQIEIVYLEAVAISVTRGN